MRTSISAQILSRASEIDDSFWMVLIGDQARSRSASFWYPLKTVCLVSSSRSGEFAAASRSTANTRSGLTFFQWSCSRRIIAFRERLSTPGASP